VPADDQGAMLARLDLGFAARRSGHARAMADAFASHGTAGRRIGGELSNPALNVGREELRSHDYAGQTVAVAPGVEVPLTNAMLHELFTRTLGQPDPTFSSYYAYAVNAALAVRLLQLGSPAVAMEIGGYDLHSGEKSLGPELYHFTGRLWAALGWLLESMPDPIHGGSYLDHTLCLTMSDFGRDGIDGGFNSGEGSDHGSESSCWYLAHAVMGAGVATGRVIAPCSTDDYDGSAADEQYSHRDLLATLLWSFGLDPANEEWGFPDVKQPIPGLWGG
jgi:hypothetical protein